MMQSPFLQNTSGEATDVSVIVPSRNRAGPVENLLHCLLKQTIAPKEVIIVDDSDNSETESSCSESKAAFLRRNTALIYCRGKRENSSIGAARNIGIEQAAGHIVIFVDDDVRFDNNVIEHVLACYQRNPEALGVSAYISYFNDANFFSKEASVFPSFRSFLINAYRAVFFLPHFEKGRQRVLPSGHVTFPYMLTEDANVEWVSGIFSSYRQQVLRKFRFDERLVKYSLWEDVDLAARILKEHPNSLFMTPCAAVVHEKSPLARRSNQLLSYILAGYHCYFFLKNMPRRFSNRFAFIWSWVGTLSLRLLLRDANEFRTMMNAYVYSLRHMKEISKGTFPFLDWIK
jgi:glycosyltransferase involved in cell wall biosynthesis